MKEKNIIGKVIISYFSIMAVITSLTIILNYFGGLVFQRSSSSVNFSSYFGNYMFFNALPLFLILCAAKYIYMLPVKKAIIIPIIDKEEYRPVIDKAQQRMQYLPFFLYALNISAALLYFAVTVNQLKYLHGFPGRAFFYFIMVISCAGIYTSIQSTVNNIILIPVCKHLKIHSISDFKKKRGLNINVRINLLIAFLAVFIISFFLHNQFTMYGQKNLEAGLLQAVINNEITIEKAADLYNGTQQETAVKSPVYMKAVKQNAVKFNTYVTMSFIILCLLSLAAAYIFSYEFKGRINYQQKVMNNILSGKEKFSKRISILQFDELGRLSGTINQFVEKFKEILESILTNTKSVDSVSGTLDNSLQSASTAIEEMVSAINQITTYTGTQMEIVEKIHGKVEEMLIGIEGTYVDVSELSGFVEETSTAMQETTASIQSVSRNTEKVDELANNLVSISKDGSVSVNNTIDAIKEIENATQSVKDIVNIINDLSSQTDLLAINAAIEAAHAGDKGKGFAIVAEEVRKLAEKSKANATQIINHITAMTDKVEKGVSLSYESGEAFSKIDHDINLTTQLIKEVSAAMHEQSSGTAEILKSIDSMLQATVEVKEITDDIKGQSQDIHTHMQELFNVSHDINNATDEQNKGNQEILTLITNVKDASSKNVSIVGNLHKIINSFQFNNA